MPRQEVKIKRVQVGLENKKKNKTRDTPPDRMIRSEVSNFLLLTNSHHQKRKIKIQSLTPCSRAWIFFILSIHSHRGAKAKMLLAIMPPPSHQ